MQVIIFAYHTRSRSTGNDNMALNCNLPLSLWIIKIYNSVTQPGYKNTYHQLYEFC